LLKITLAKIIKKLYNIGRLTYNGKVWTKTMKLGITGLPNVGKSALFNALTNSAVPSENYPFCTIDPNVGVVAVPDKRLDYLASLYDPEKYTPAVIEFVDIAGLVKGASKGEGLGNKFLGHIREVDAILHVIRCFNDPDVAHVDGSVDPMRDLETINFELYFADMEVLERRIDRTKKMMKGDKTLAAELALYERIYNALVDGTAARALSFTTEEEKLVATLGLLSYKPVLYVANIGEENIGSEDDDENVNKLREYAAKENSGVITICAGLESEIALLDEEERKAFLEDMGIEERGLDRLIRTSYDVLGLVSYLTGGPKEVRAWTIKRGTKAPQAAGKIHSDFERGFIRAEVIAFDDLVECGNMTVAKEKGLVRSEGKEYTMQDGDVVLFRINV
jgi:GTP-binding protein YchF